MLPLTFDPMESLPRTGVFSVSRRSALADCLFLSLILSVSALPYLGRLGFYSDDWILLAQFVHSRDQSLLGLFTEAYGGHEASRPVYVLLLSALYRSFGLQPLGYHLINFAFLVAAVCLCYLVLRELGWPRVVTLSAPLVFAFLPNYSTDRFWIAACHGNVSVALYFLSAYSDIKALKARPERFWVWRIVGLASLVGSVLTYELTLPLLLGTSIVILVAPRFMTAPAGSSNTQRRRVISLVNIAALVTFALVVASTTVRGLTNRNVVGHLGGVIKGALAVNFGWYGMGLPYTVWRAVGHYHTSIHLALGAGIGLFIFAYLDRAWRDADPHMTIIKWPRVIMGGLIVFGLGYVIFAATPAVVFTATGIGNRTAIVAAVGVAVFDVGLLGLMATHMRSRIGRPRLFAAALATLCVCGYLVTGAISSNWLSAYRQEQAILTDIQEHVPRLPAGSTLILDGVCPYDGPAVVFESNWDLAGALQIAYRDRTLHADVVTPYLTVTDTGLTTLIYGALFAEYPYSENLLVYHSGRKTTFPLKDAESVRTYFAQITPDRSNGCPTGSPGSGVEIF